MNLLQNHIYYFAITTGMSLGEDFTIECLQTTLDNEIRYVKQIEYESLTEKFFITYVRRLTLDTIRIEVTSSTPLCALIKTTISNSVLFLVVEKSVGITYGGSNYLHIPIVTSVNEFNSDISITLTPDTNYTIVNVKTKKTMNLVDYPYNPTIINNIITLEKEDLIEMAFGDGLNAYAININVTAISLSDFSLVLYQNNAENNRVDKDTYLDYVGVLNGTLRTQCSMIRPSISIEMNSVPNFNYVWIPAFNRYYFVTSITSVQKDIWNIDLSVDVLMSYKDLIYQQNAYVDRQENDYDKNLDDENRILKKDVNYSYHEIENTAFDVDKTGTTITPPVDREIRFIMTIVEAD